MTLAAVMFCRRMMSWTSVTGCSALTKPAVVKYCPLPQPSFAVMPVTCLQPIPCVQIFSHPVTQGMNIPWHLDLMKMLSPVPLVHLNSFHHWLHLRWDSFKFPNRFLSSFTYFMFFLLADYVLFLTFMLMYSTVACESVRSWHCNFDLYMSSAPLARQKLQ